MTKNTNQGIPADYPVQPLHPNDAAEVRTKCGLCGRSWDDGIVTSMTPAPSGRCPFESFHSPEADDEEDEKEGGCWCGNNCNRDAGEPCPDEEIQTAMNEPPRSDEPELIDIGEFLTNHGITMTYERVKSNPNQDNLTKEDATWAATASHWKCTFTMRDNGRTLETYYSMGSGLKDPPEADDVLDSLASDARTIQADVIFEEWADDYGYNSDSRKAERLFNTIREQSARLRRFLTYRLYRVLLDDVEPL